MLQKMNGLTKAKLAKGKQLFQQFYNIPEGVDPKTRRKFLTDALKNYEGFNTATESEALATFTKQNIDYYYVSPTSSKDEIPSYELIEQVIVDPSYPTKSLLRIPTGNGEFHIMTITDPEAITGIRICPYCRIHCHNTKNGHLDRFLKHVEECKENGGKKLREVKLPNTQKPYAPHIQKQPIYAFLLAHNLQNCFKPTQYYITFDFETLEAPVNEELTEQTTLDANLVPFMVSATVKLPGKIETKNFCLATNENFIEEWIMFLFESAQGVVAANKEQYNDVFNLLNEEQANTFSKLLEKEYSTAKVIGFNSGKFDLNLILANLCSSRWRIRTIIGSTSQFKMVSVFKLNDGNPDDKYAGLRFIDIRNYIAGGTLDQFTRDFGHNDGKRVKAYFPYQFVTTENWKDELPKKEPFAKEHFYSDLSKANISDEEYAIYLEDYKNYKNRLDYFIHYCDQDVMIMIDPIDSIINETFEYKIDMLHNMSLSSNASMIRYALAYEDFDPRAFYPDEPGESDYMLTKKSWHNKVQGYFDQDRKAKRDTKNNVKDSDYEYFRDLFLTNKCYLCGETFKRDNVPTLDRVDNNKGHSKDNVMPCCEYCNKCKSNNEKETMQLLINLRKFALSRKLPFTLSVQAIDAYYILRSGITGGLSNVQHRINLKGITHINKFTYDATTNTVSNYDTENVMTHFVGTDFNSLYPSAFSSNEHQFIKYTGGKMYMPGRLTKTIQCVNTTFKKNAIAIIKRKDTLFVADIKGHIPKERINEFINFLPIIRNKDIITNKETIGEYMYDYMKNNGIKVDDKERKLTQLAEVDDFTSFSSYYLWYLMDRFGFVIDDIRTLLLFEKNDCFHKFANQFMETRQKAELEGKKGKGLFCKISLNGSYGYDAMNTSKYSQSKIQDKRKAECTALSSKYKSMKQLNEEYYQVLVQEDNYKCETCIQEAFFTLDNAKYWYLVFIYDFMYKCMDTNRFHFIEGDTDSAYWAISGDPSLDNKQAFQAIITDKQFYDENIYKFAPYDFFCFDEKNKLKLETKVEQKAHEKKLLGLAIEKQGDNMIALCPKCYTSFNGPIELAKLIAMKMKGVSLKQNKDFTPEHYLRIIVESTTFDGMNINLTLKNGKMARISMGKCALTGKHTKAVCQPNGACLPFINGARYK